MQVADLASFLVGLATLICAAMTINEYGWRWKARTPYELLAHGLLCTFGATAVNALYWSVIVRGIALAGDPGVLAAMRLYGGFGDLLFKGLAVYGMWCCWRASRAAEFEKPPR